MKIMQILAIAIFFGFSACTTGTTPQEPLDHKTQSEKSAIKTADIYGVYRYAAELDNMVLVHVLYFLEDHTAAEYLFFGNPQKKSRNIEVI